MDDLKFYSFIYLTVAMGSLGNLPSSSGVNAQNATPSVDLNTTSLVTNITPVTTTVTPVQNLTKAVTVTLPSSVTLKSKIQPTKSDTGKDGIGKSLILMGGLLLLCVLLLVSTMVLACKVCSLKKRLRNKYRPSADGASYNQNGVAGPGETEAGIMLEEIKLVKDDEEAEPDGTQVVGGGAENSGKENACHTKELDGDPATLEPAPAASAEPNESPAPQTTTAPTSEPIPDKA